MGLNNLANFAQMWAQFQHNPMGMLAQKFNIPQNMQNPQEIVQHLLNSGQVSQQQVNQAMQMRDNPNLRHIFR